MHWIVQKNIFKPHNYQLLTNALDSLSISYTPVIVPIGTFSLDPEVVLEGKVYVCGALKMARIARERGWMPGSFLNDQFNFDVWLAELGSEMLNSDIIKGKLSDINVKSADNFFLRPLEDNKAFDGQVMDCQQLNIWRKDSSKKSLMNIDVLASSLKSIYKEYRLFFVNGVYVTGSVYKVGGMPQLSTIVDDDAIEYANKIVKLWSPISSFVIDICLSDEGFKVIEFNNINSSGFYACDVKKYVDAIQRAYA